MSEKDLTPEEEATLQSTDLSVLHLPSAAEMLAEEPDEKPKKGKRKKAEAKKPEQESNVAEPDQNDKPEPTMADPAWQEFVLSKFTDDETDKDGNPYVWGLQRVVRQLLGPIVSMKAVSIQTPKYLAPGHPYMEPAVAEYEVQILWKREEDETCNTIVTFREAADCHLQNADPDFARFATAMAGTRAKGRCFRTALGLGKIAAEEATVIPVEEPEIGGMITKMQKDWLDVIGRRQNVNLWKYLNAGKTQYASIDEVPNDVADAACKHLSNMQTKNTVRPDLRGYIPEWREGR